MEAINAACQNETPVAALSGRKTYVLDTNVLLHDPTAVAAFMEHHVVIPMTVLEELDHIKDRRDKTVSREARIAIQMIEKVVGGASPGATQAGVEIPGSNFNGPLGTLAIYPDQLIQEDGVVPFLNATQDQANDNRIINVALKLQSEQPDSLVCLVTKDINMRIKARALGLPAEDYFNDQVLEDRDLMYSGVMTLPTDFWPKHGKAMESWADGKSGTMFYRVTGPLVPSMLVNQFVYQENPDGSSPFYALVREINGKTALLQTLKENIPKLDSVSRKIVNLDFTFVYGGVELALFSNSGINPRGLSDRVADYTNLDNARGVFSSISRIHVYGIPLSEQSIDTIAMNPNTKNLNFVSSYEEF